MSTNDLLSLFDSLCELPAQERERRLQDIESADAALADRLRSLLRADATPDERIAHDIDQQADLAAAAWRAVATPADFASFHLLRELGAGGMGVVWLAERKLGAGDDAPTQLVAIKFMRNQSPALMRAFARERDALARLEHPGIARLIDAGLSPDDVPYIATEYVDGSSLTEYVRAHQLDLPSRLILVESLCEAVDYAHRQLLIHRDIKPSNILVDQTGRVRLLDFGIAKALDAGLAEQTQNNPMTPVYASPEQALGEPVSTATDVFALGLLLFELLTGSQPSQRRSLTPGDMVHKIGSVSIEAPSLCLRQAADHEDQVLTQGDWRKRIRGDLDLIVLKALRREPERRYPSARALAEDLRRFREGKTIAARPDSRRYRWRKFVSRHRLVVASVGIALVALFAGFGVALWQASVARANAKDARAQLQRAEAIKEFTQSLFQEQDPMARSTAIARTPREMIAIGIERARTQFQPNDPVRAELLGDLAGIQVVLGDFASALAVFDEVSLATQTQDPGSVAAARLQSARAIALAGVGRRDEALSTAQAASTVLARELGANDPQTVRAEQRVLRLQIPNDGNDLELLRMANRLVQATERVFGPASPEALSALVDLSVVQERLAKSSELLQTLENLVKRIEAALGVEHLMLARPLAKIGDVYRVMRRHDLAMPYFDRAVAIARQHEDKGMLGRVLSRRGDNFRRMGNYADATVDFDEAIQLMPADSAEAAQTEQMRGSLARAKGDLDAAAKHLRASQLGFERALGKPNTYSWTSALGLVSVEVLRGHAAAVEQLALDAEIAMRELSPPPSLDVFLATSVVGQVKTQLGQAAAALSYFDEAIAIGIEVYGAEHPAVLEARVLRAGVLPRSMDEVAKSELEAVLARPDLPAELAVIARQSLDQRAPLR